MVSRCPSCGSPTPEDERICSSCGWDFVARKRTKPGAPASPSTPSAPPPPAEPPSGGFALPPARNLGDGPPGLKPLPKLAPGSTTGPAAGENPFTLPAARSLTSPETPPAKMPLPEKPAPAPPPPRAPAKDGLGARLFRSLRGETKPAEPPAAKPEDVPPAPEAPERKGFSLPAARIVPADDAPVEKPRVIETPVDDVPVEESPLPPGPELRKPSKPETPAPRPRPEPENPGGSALAPFPEPAARFDGGDAPILPAPEEPLLPASAEALLPTSAHDGPPLPPRPAPAAPSRPATAPAATPAPQASAAAESRKNMVMIAAIAGAALGTVSVVAVYLLMRPDSAPASPGAVARPAFPPAPGTSAAPAPLATPVSPAALAAPPSPVQQSPAPLPVSPASGAPPKALPPPGPIVAVPAPVPAPVAARPAAPAPAAASAAASEPSRPAATFAATPRLVLSGAASKTAPPPPAAAPAPAAASAAAPAAEEAKPRKPKGPRWVFEGMVFDLLTARGVFGAKLIFVNADGDVVGETDTGPAGRYKIALPAGSGYKLKISHGDYTERYIDEGDATTSLRDATPEERRMLMSAAARNIPWTGDTAKPVRRDLALVPKTPEEP